MKVVAGLPQIIRGVEVPKVPHRPSTCGQLPQIMGSNLRQLLSAGFLRPGPLVPIRRLNHDFEHAEIDPDHRLKLIKLRNEAMTKVTAAQHHARVDDARTFADQQRRERRRRHLRIDQERRRDTGLGRER